MLIMLLAAAAMAPQSSPTLPPPNLEFDDTVTYMMGGERPLPKPRPPSTWQGPAAAPAQTAPAAAASAANDVGLRPGDILIDTARHRLMYAVSSDRVESFPVAVGKQGASWKGTAVVGRKVAFPTWRPTPRMRRNERHLPSVVPPGPANPLGTRAIYLFRNGRDTMFRIHGTNAPWSIGKSVSHGCIRMLNASVEHLYDQVQLGARVTVR